jgi:hypothetical protein
MDLGKENNRNDDVVINTNSTDKEILNILIPNAAKVLFIYSNDLYYVAEVTNAKSLDTTVFENNAHLLELAKSLNLTTVAGSLNKDIIGFNSKEYDIVIADNVLAKARFVKDFISDISRIGNYAILGHDNSAYYKNRLFFLLYGSFFVERSFDIIEDNDSAWFNKDPWNISHKDILSLCRSSSIVIEKGIYYGSSKKLCNIYNLRGYPGLMAKKAYYLLNDQPSGLLPNYTFGARAV